MKETNKSIKSDISVLDSKLSGIDRAIQEKQGFFGFTNMNTMVIYFIILLLLCFSNLISCNHNELITKQTEEINYLNEQIETFKTENPKLARKYFIDD